MTRTLILITTLSLCSILTANGQSFRAGINAGYLMHLQPEDGPGAGVQAGLWASWPVARKSRLQVSIGHRRLGGFSRLRLDTRETFTETENYRTVAAIQLIALHYVDAELGWAFQPAPDSPWSYYIGGYYAHLSGWQDFGRTTTTYDESGSQGSRSFDPQWPIRDELSSYDFGLRLGVSYQLLKGLAVQAHMQKGIPDLVPGSLFTDTPNDRLTAFSLGLSARLF